MFSLNSMNNIRCLNYSFRQYALCCPPRPPHGQGPCPPPATPGAGKRIAPPSECQPAPVPPNPCVPKFHGDKDSWKKYRFIVLFICFPLIFIQAFAVFGGHKTHDKGECRDYEYMRRFTKRFPWREGETKSLFHNDSVNYKPGECEPPLLDCD